MTFRSALRLEVPHWRYTSFTGLVLISIALIVLAQNYYKYAGSEAYSVGLSLAYNLIVYASFALFIPPIIRISNRVETYQFTRVKWFVLHLLAGFALVLAHMLFCNGVLYAVGLSSSVIFPRFLTKYLTNVVQVHLLVYWAIVIIRQFNKPVALPEETGQEAEQWARFKVKHRGRTLYLSFDQVYWIEALDHYQKLHTAQGYHLIKSSMKQLETVLPRGTFQRAHRSYFVNLHQVDSISRNPAGLRGTFVHLKDGTALRLGDAYAARFRA